MCSFRRLPVYVLHDGSAEAVRELSRLLDDLRRDPRTLETVWICFISLAGKAKLVIPLTDICEVGNVGSAELESSAPDLEGGISIFAHDVRVNVRKITPTTRGDWRPVLVLLLGADPGSGSVVGHDVIKDIRGTWLAFVGKPVSPLSRARWKDAGFDLIDVVDGPISERFLGLLNVGGIAPEHRMSMPTYQVSRDGKLVGNFDDAQVRQMYESGILSPTDLAWTEGMQEWKSLAVIFQGVVPPPFPKNVSGAAQSSAPNAALAFAVPIGRSGWAILAGYLGLVSVLILPAPFAILAGILALMDIRKNPHKLGKVRAWFGIISGGACLLFVILLMLYASFKGQG